MWYAIEKPLGEHLTIEEFSFAGSQPIINPRREAQMATHTTKTTDTEPRGGHTRLLTLDEAADRLRVSRWGIRRLINERELPTVQLGRRRLVTEADLDDLIASRRQGGPNGRW